MTPLRVRKSLGSVARNINSVTEGRAWLETHSDHVAKKPASNREWKVGAGGGDKKNKFVRNVTKSRVGTVENVRKENKCVCINNLHCMLRRAMPCHAAVYLS